MAAEDRPFPTDTNRLRERAGNEHAKGNHETASLMCTAAVELETLRAMTQAQKPIGCICPAEATLHCTSMLCPRKGYR